MLPRRDDSQTSQRCRNASYTATRSIAEKLASRGIVFVQHQYSQLSASRYASTTGLKISNDFFRKLNSIFAVLALDVSLQPMMIGVSTVI